MVQTLPSIDSIHNEEKVSSISINASGDKILIGDCKGNVLIYSFGKDGLNLEHSITLRSTIIDVIWHNEKFIVLDEVEGVHM